MPIETKRLLLRLFNEEDFGWLRELDSDPAVVRYRSRPVITAEMTRQFLDFARLSVLEEPRSYYAYAIEGKAGVVSSGRQGAGRTFLGQCGMTAIPDKDDHEKSVYLWYSLLPRYWGNGFMTEAIQALVQLGFGKFGLSYIEAESDPKNINSYRVMEKAGLHYTGTLGRLDDQGNLCERVHYEMTYQDFLKKSWSRVKIVEPV